MNSLLNPILFGVYDSGPCTEKLHFTLFPMIITFMTTLIMHYACMCVCVRTCVFLYLRVPKYSVYYQSEESLAGPHNFIGLRVKT